ncbi:MAG: hypothetical protein QOH08_2533 [Chloroflexota bacterium]|nr:hypothetical protein [Chloroflexota bacterium]
MKATRGTAEWAYRCTDDGVDAGRTNRVLDEAGFLWRSVHNVDGHKIANVKSIEVGDTIHVYFVEGGKERYLASYLVEPPRERADPETPAVEAVRHGPLFDELTDAGYHVDAVLECFTGFRVKRDFYPKSVEKAPGWIGRNTIARIKR